MTKKRITAVALALCLTLWFLSVGDMEPDREPPADVPALPALPALPLPHARSSTAAVAPPLDATVVEQEAAPEGVEVRCQIGLVDQPTLRSLTLAQGRYGRPAQGSVSDGELVFYAPHDRGMGAVVFEGYRRASLSWASVDGQLRCELEAPARRSVFVQGRVNAAVAAADGAVWVEGCGDSTAALDSMGGYSMSVVAQSCSLRACRRQGQLRLCGPAINVQLFDDSDVLVDLDAPDYAPAGIGIELYRVDGGVLIGKVLPGSPGMAAGLEGGDLITAVDGEPAAGMELDEFISWAIGPEGTDVVLEVDTQDGPAEYVIERGLVN